MIAVSRCASTEKVYVKGKSAVQSACLGCRMLFYRLLQGVEMQAKRKEMHRLTASIPGSRSRGIPDNAAFAGAKP